MTLLVLLSLAATPTPAALPSPDPLRCDGTEHAGWQLRHASFSRNYTALIANQWPADLGTRDPDFMLRCALGPCGDPVLIQHLLEMGAGANTPDPTDYNTLPTATAVANRRHAALDMLLAHGADPNGKNPNTWRTALHAAADIADAEAITLLLEKGADVNALGLDDRDDTRLVTPLDVAKRSGYPAAASAAKLLQDHGGQPAPQPQPLADLGKLAPGVYGHCTWLNSAVLEVTPSASGAAPSVRGRIESQPTGKAESDPTICEGPAGSIRSQGDLLFFDIKDCHAVVTLANSKTVHGAPKGRLYFGDPDEGKKPYVVDGDRLSVFNAMDHDTVCAAFKTARGRFILGNVAAEAVK